MSCFVYDKITLLLSASMDDQHFATFFQYNEEGQLVRKLKETERGLLTIEETQHLQPTVTR